VNEGPLWQIVASWVIVVVPVMMTLLQALGIVSARSFGN